MHKAASTFVADVLFNSLARRTAYYDLFHVGSFLIRYLKRENIDAGITNEENWANLARFFEDSPIPKSNGLIGRVYPLHMAAIERHLGHPIPDEGNRLLVMRRDPRDALVSLYYSMATSHTVEEVEENRELFIDRRSKLQQQSVCEGIKSLLRNNMDAVIPEFLHCTDLILGNKNICDLPYEKLIEQPSTWLSKFVEATELEDITDEQWFASMLDHLKPPETEDPTSHKRRMRPGNWKTVFDDELSEMVKERIGERLAEFDYTW